MATSTLTEFISLFKTKREAAQALNVSPERVQMALKRNSGVVVEHNQKQVVSCYLITKRKWGG